MTPEQIANHVAAVQMNRATYRHLEEELGNLESGPRVEGSDAALTVNTLERLRVARDTARELVALSSLLPQQHAADDPQVDSAALKRDLRELDAVIRDAVSPALVRFDHLAVMLANVHPDLRVGAEVHQ